MAPPKGHQPYKGCETGGRPLRFSDEEIEKMAEEFLDWLDVEGNYWIKKYCLEKRINPDYMSDWCERSDKFYRAYLIGKQKQEQKIFEGGMIGKFNSNIVKLALTNHHGWAERTESKISGDAQNPLQCIIEKVSSKKSEENGESESD